MDMEKPHIWAQVAIQIFLQFTEQVPFKLKIKYQRFSIILRYWGLSIDTMFDHGKSRWTILLTPEDGGTACFSAVWGYLWCYTGYVRRFWQVIFTSRCSVAFKFPFNFLWMNKKFKIPTYRTFAIEAQKNLKLIRTYHFQYILHTWGTNLDIVLVKLPFTKNISQILTTSVSLGLGSFHTYYLSLVQMHLIIQLYWSPHGV
jgi:hypothetical protein